MNIKTIKFELFEIDGMFFGFTEERVDRNNIPKEFFVYDIRDNTDSVPYCIEKSVMVNRMGTIVGITEVPLDADGKYHVKDLDGWGFLESCCFIKKLAGKLRILQSTGEPND